MTGDLMRADFSAEAGASGLRDSSVGITRTEAPAMPYQALLAEESPLETHLDQEESDRLPFFEILFGVSLSRAANLFSGGVEGVILLAETILSQAPVNREHLCAVFETDRSADLLAECPFEDRRAGLVF